MRRSISGLNFFEKLSGSIFPGKSRENGGLLDSMADMLFNAPKTTFTIIIVLTLMFWAASSGLLPGQDNSMSDNISTNIDQYIPEGTDEKDILDIVRENWATKVVIVFIQTGNAFDTNCLVNVTDRDVLEEISSVEGDDVYSMENGKPGANYARGDSGEYDWIEYVFSLATLIKEINSSTPRMINMLEEEMATELEDMFGVPVDVSPDDPYLEENAKFAIPENQSQVDQILAQIPYDVLTSFCADTNDDGIWDSTYTMMGCLEETPDEAERDFIDRVIENRRTVQPGDANDPYFEDKSGPHHTEMTQTGLIAIMIDITDECNLQLMETMPLAAGLVVLVMLVTHRSWKVFLIAGIPLACTIFWTFGIVTLTGLDLSPLILAAMPMLIGLSVDYSLHISNRITEFEEGGYTIREGIRKTLHTTGVAVLLSAVTTMIGFAALLVAPLSPIRILGLMLIIGIASAFFLSITIVPCLILMFRYRKPEMRVWEKVAEVPVRFKWHIIIVVLIVIMISLANLSTMTETKKEGEEDFDTQGIESLDAIIEYSHIWAKGSMSLLVIEPNKEAKQGIYRNGGALNDTEFLDQMNWLEENLTGIEKVVDVEDVSAMTIVDLFKSVALNLSWATVDGHLPHDLPIPVPIDPIIDPITDRLTFYYTITYWDFIHLSDDKEFQSLSEKHSQSI